MTFAARETHRLNGRPFHLYTFTYGPESTSVRRYTNLATEFVYGGETFYPLRIEHGEVVSSGNLDKTALDIRLPESGPIPDLYRDETPSAVVGLVIRQGHVGDADLKVHWAGKVVGTSYEDELMILTCEPISSSMRRSGLTLDYQYTCPLVLYGNQCRASRAAGTSSHTVVAVDGGVITLAAGWTTEAMRRHYLGGIFEWVVAGRVHRRTIISAGDTVMTLSAPTNGLLAGATVSLVLSCDKTMATCRTVHNNILNYGGQPQIPLVNPVGITNNYY